MRITVRTLKNPPSSISAFTFRPGMRYVLGESDSFECSAAQFTTFQSTLSGAANNGDIVYSISDVSLLDFDVVGDGVHDDTAGWNAAFAFALAAGVPLYVPPVAINYLVSTFTFNGPMTFFATGNILQSALAGSKTVVVSDSLLLADATSGNVTYTLPLLTHVHQGQVFAFKRIDSSINTVTVAANGSDTIEGSASASLLALGYLRLMAYSTGWLKV